MAQAFITIAIPFYKEHLERVDDALESLANKDAGNAPKPEIKGRLDAIEVEFGMIFANTTFQVL